MSLPIKLAGKARRDLEEARDYYRDEAPQYLDAFDEEIWASLDRLQYHPRLYQVFAKDFRRAVLRRFPYSIYYTLRKGHIEVRAILHQKQDFAWWLRDR